jgi:hypothetical protein
MTKINIKPISGAKIPDPITGEILKESGEIKTDSIFWRRRIKFGEAELLISNISNTIKTAPEV